MANPLKPITEKVADGVWRHAGDIKQGMNIYLLAEEDGSVTLFDGGTASMVESVRAAAEEIGPIKRIVLGHGHADHRGVASSLGVPVLCHEDERADTDVFAAVRADGAGYVGDTHEVRTSEVRREEHS